MILAVEFYERITVDVCPTFLDSADKGIQESKSYTVKAGSTVEMKCSYKSNLASVVWKFNKEIISVAPPKYIVNSALIIFNVTESDAGTYQCWSQELVMNKAFSQLVIKHVLELEKTPPPMISTTPPPPPTRMEGIMETTRLYKVKKEKTTKMSMSTSTPPIVTTSVGGVTYLNSKMTTPTVSVSEEVFSSLPNVEKALYLTNNNDCSLLIILVIVFFLLFFILLTYNCYKGFLPEACLKYRSAVLSSKKKSPPSLKDCEQGLKETLVEKGCTENQCSGTVKAPPDTGYETDADCGNGNITHKEDETTEEKEKDQPFDVKCEIKYADSDGD